MSLGNEGILANEIKAVAYDAKLKADIFSYLVGLGGKDVTKENIRKIIKTKNKETNFIYE